MASATVSGTVDALYFNTPTTVTTPGSYATNQAGRGVYVGSGVTSYKYTSGLLTVSKAPGYYFDFHYNDYGSFAESDIIFYGDDLDSSSLTYVSGAINGYSPASIDHSGNTFYASDVASATVSGTVDALYFNTPTTVTALGSYATNQAGRGVYVGSGVTSYRYSSGSLTVVSAAGGVPEPGTWAMFILGTGMVGYALRQRKRASGMVRSAG